MNPVGIDLLSVTYEKEGQAIQILLSPMEGFWAWPAHWNENVADWFQTLRAAVIAATGREPGNTPADKLGLPAGSKLICLLYCLPVAVGIISVSTLVRHRPGSQGINGNDLGALIFIFAMLAVACIAPLIFALRHRLRSASSAKHDSPRPGYGLPMGIVILIIFTMYLVFATGRFAMQPVPKPAASAVLEASPPVAAVIQAQPEMSSAELSRFFAIPAKLAELPHLRFVAWQDRWASNQHHRAWHPDGTEITSPFELEWVRAVAPPGCDVSQTSAANQYPRFLHLWFAHPLFDRQSLNQVTLSDRDRKLIVPVSSATAAGAAPASPATGNLGWLTHTLSVGEGTNSPRSINVQLRYTIGPVDHEVRLLPKSNTWVGFDGDVQLNGIGQDADGRTFVAIAQAGQMAAIRQFIIVAVTRDGRNLESSDGTGSAGPADGRGVRVSRFAFNVPLVNVEYFRAGTRPVRELNLVDVRLPVDQH